MQCDGERARIPASLTHFSPMESYQSDQTISVLMVAGDLFFFLFFVFVGFFIQI